MPTYYDPFKEIQSFMNQALTQTKSLGMPMDLYRKGDTYHAEIDLPGVDPKSIDIDVEDRSITIRAERKAPPVSQGDEWVSRERAFGTYARQITVGNGLALDKVSGQYNDGVLELTIPMAEEAKSRKVQVQRGPGGRGSDQNTITSSAEDVPTDSSKSDGDDAEGQQTGQGEEQHAG